MKPPKHIALGPHCYELMFVPDGALEGAGAGGLCQPCHLTIAVDGGLPKSMKAETVLHEIVHALLAAAKLEEDVEEMVCRALGPGLLSLIRNNRNLIAWVQS